MHFNSKSNIFCLSDLSQNAKVGGLEAESNVSATRKSYEYVYTLIPNHFICLMYNEMYTLLACSVHAAHSL